MKTGIIGCGNMARAIVSGMLKKGFCKPGEVLAADAAPQAAQAFVLDFGVRRAESNRALCAESDVLLLAVKPQVYEEVIEEIREACHEGQLIISIAPGKSLAWLAEKFQAPVGLVRAMPNTPAMVGEGLTAWCCRENVTEGQQKLAQKLLSSFGRAEAVPEHLMDAVVAVSGSSPAYAFIMVEAMADAAVAQGVPRQQAIAFAAQALLGSAKMVLETGRHPAELKDMVCSPGGTTIEAVRMLEKTGFRSSLMEAMDACWKKSRGM